MDAKVKKQTIYILSSETNDDLSYQKKRQKENPENKKLFFCSIK